MISCVIKHGSMDNAFYLKQMVNQAYLNQEKNYFFCSKSDCDFCQKTSQYEEELSDKKFNTANSHIQNWFII